MNHELSKTLPLFTYGSLMENFFNYELYLKDRIKEKPQKARMKGELYHLDIKGYPALLPGSQWVYGEVFELVDFEQDIQVLDQLEGFNQGVPNEYHREKTTVYGWNETTQSYDRPLTAYVYRYAVEHDPTFEQHRILLATGDWRHYMEKNTIKTSEKQES